MKQMDKWALQNVCGNLNFGVVLLLSYQISIRKYKVTLKIIKSIAWRKTEK